jgi:ribosome modulation factor
VSDTLNPLAVALLALEGTGAMEAGNSRGAYPYFGDTNVIAAWLVGWDDAAAAGQPGPRGSGDYVF